ncbi:MAG: hypothetical protein GF364_12395 [Candidatus Lokiarchaeota archaeon]|nr:hypothetical protein [Candidatus Lokiarchaeota archaeon]
MAAESLWESILNWFPESAAWLLIFGGLIAITWLGYERKRKKGFIRIKTEDWEETDVSKFLRILSYLGIALGVIMIWSAVVGMINNIAPSFEYADVTANDFDWLTSISLIVVGLVCLMKPINDLPWSGLLGLFAGIGSAIIITLSMPEELVSNPDYKWYILGFGAAIATAVGVAIKFWIGSIQTISKVLSYPPVALIVAVYCFVQGFMVLGLGYGLANL